MSASEATVKAVREAMRRHESTRLRMSGGKQAWLCKCRTELPDEPGSWHQHQAEAVAAAAEAAALEAAADTWQRGAWGDTPRKADRVADRIAAANHVTAWLRERAGEVRD